MEAFPHQHRGKENENGAHDVMTYALGSYAMPQRLPNAKVVLYSNAGHGFLFQRAVVVERLDECCEVSKPRGP